VLLILLRTAEPGTWRLGLDFKLDFHGLVLHEDLWGTQPVSGNGRDSMIFPSKIQLKP